MMYDVQLTITVIEHKVSRCLLINVIQNQIASYSLISRVNYSNLLFTWVHDAPRLLLLYSALQLHYKFAFGMKWNINVSVHN